MNVGSDNAFFGRSRRFLGGARDPLFAEDIFSLAQITIRLDQGFFAIHHTGVGLITQLLDEGRVDFSHREKIRGFELAF